MSTFDRYPLVCPLFTGTLIIKVFYGILSVHPKVTVNLRKTSTDRKMNGLKHGDIFCGNSTRCEMYLNSEFFSGLHFPVFGRNTEICRVNLRLQRQYGKIRITKNSKLRLFSRSRILSRMLLLPKKTTAKMLARKLILCELLGLH